MKAISLLQPWATLVAIGAKTIETRSWYTKYRGELAIHASARCTKKALTEALTTFPFRTALIQGRIESIKHFPLGAVIATCRLVDCVKIIDWFIPDPYSKPLEGCAVLKNDKKVTGHEYCFGNYTPGRYAWILEDVQPLPEPIPARGRLGLWEWEPPEGVIL